MSATWFAQLRPAPPSTVRCADPTRPLCVRVLESTGASLSEDLANAGVFVYSNCCLTAKIPPERIGNWINSASSKKKDRVIIRRNAVQ